MNYMKILVHNLAKNVIFLILSKVPLLQLWYQDVR